MEHSKQKSYGRSKGIASDLLEQIIQHNYHFSLIICGLVVSV